MFRRGAWDIVDVNRLLKFSDIDASIQGHLCRVYVSLAGALACTALSVACIMMFHLVNSIFTVGLGVLGTAVGLTGLAMWRGDAAGGPKDRARHALLLTVAGGQGLIICPVAKLAFDINPQAVLPVILATVAVFVSFSAAALIAKRRAYLFLGGYFSSAVTALMVLHLGSWPTAGVAAATGNEVSLYLSLLAFAGFIVFDTQLIIERASIGEKDHIQHALELFLDVVGLAVQALAVLTRKAARGGSRRRAKRSGPHS